MITRISNTDTDFKEKGFIRSRSVRNHDDWFPHEVFYIDKKYPDMLLMMQRRGFSQEELSKGKFIQLNIYAKDDLSIFPDDIFFDKQLNWHWQHFDKKGLICAAGIYIQNENIFIEILQSDLLQQLYRSSFKNYKTELENRYSCWYKMTLNAIMDFAITNNLKKVYCPTGEQLVSETKMKINGTLFLKIYNFANERYECELKKIKNAEYWAIDVQANKEKVVILKSEKFVHQRPFKLYVISTSEFRTYKTYNDLLEGLVKYSNEAKEHGFEIHYVEDINHDELAKKEKVDGIFAAFGNGLENLKKTNYKIASFQDDIHWFSQEHLKNLLSFFEKVDVIFDTYYRTAMKYEVYSEFRNKFISLPWWANEYSFTKDIEWANRKNKILLAGAISPCYIFRQQILNSKNSLIEYLPFCGDVNFKTKYHGKAFLDFLVEFKGMIATSLNPIAVAGVVHSLDYTVKKYFESLGAGCLSFFEKTDDFEELGFVENKHYISITKDNFENQFLLLNNNDAKDIAKEGREFVKNNHSTKNRVITILKTLKERWL